MLMPVFVLCRFFLIVSLRKTVKKHVKESDGPAGFRRVGSGRAIYFNYGNQLSIQKQKKNNFPWHHALKMISFQG